ncbi:MAG: hypothetical protein JW864_14240 [Spirochaetes bacterium]|nr:hypothetical protein [Spirochaetota bacterium]
MKKTALLFVFFAVLYGCSSHKTVEFCEGASPEGEGINCGNKFSTGDITVFIKPESGFGITSIDINVYKKEKYKSIKIGTNSLKVDPEETAAKTNIYFYDEGEFNLEIIGDNKKIAEGAVSIIDVY